MTEDDDDLTCSTGAMQPMHVTLYKMSEYFGILETPGKLDEAPSQTIGRSENVTSEHFESLETAGKIDELPSQTGVGLERVTSEHSEILESASHPWPHSMYAALFQGLD